MMKKKLFSVPVFWGFILLFYFIPPAQAQELNQRIFSKGANQEILIGFGNRHGLEEEPFNRWFDKEYSDYKPDEQTLKKIPENTLSEVYITIVLGTWCSDSHREVPRFYKIAEILKIPENHLKVIFVDRDKTAPDIDLTPLHIARVPTFIFYRKKNELGRIIESPKISLGKDIKFILSKK